MEATVLRRDYDGQLDGGPTPSARRPAGGEALPCLWEQNRRLADRPMAAWGGGANNHQPPRVPPRVGWLARPGIDEEQGDNMDAVHRLAMVSTDPRPGGHGEGQPALGRPWLVISALVLLALSAAVFLLC